MRLAPRPNGRRGDPYSGPVSRASNPQSPIPNPEPPYPAELKLYPGSSISGVASPQANSRDGEGILGGD